MTGYKYASTQAAMVSLLRMSSYDRPTVKIKIDPNYEYCTNCGSKLPCDICIPAKPICMACGTINQNQSIYCIECGVMIKQ